MEAASDSPFSFLAAKSKGGVFRAYLKATAEHGHLATVPMVRSALGLSKQRVWQLINEGRIPTIRVGRINYVPLPALEQFLSIERKAGRPIKHDPKLAAIAKALLENPEDFA